MRLPAWLVCLAALAITLALQATEPRTALQQLPNGVKSIATTNLHNTFQLTRNVFAGSSPANEGGFAELARLGIKTIISVDGGKPNVELAHKYGMRYVHIPHGYDGINTNVQAQLIKAAQLSPEPLFVHCHHGLHRGPAAAAIICMANDGWSPLVGEAWLKAAGTGSNYGGLYQTVRQFQRPSDDRLRALPSRFPEVAKVSGLVDTMVTVDECWDHLKAVRRAGYRKSKQHPDIDPAHEAVILWEHYREAQRLPDSVQHGARFIELLKKAEGEAREAEALLRGFAQSPSPDKRQELDRSFDAMTKTCASCHKEYRDQRN